MGLTNQQVKKALAAQRRNSPRGRRLAAAAARNQAKADPEAKPAKKT